MNKRKEAIKLLKSISAAAGDIIEKKYEGSTDTQDSEESEDVSKAFTSASVSPSTRFHEYAAQAMDDACNPNIGTIRRAEPGGTPIVPIRMVEQPVESGQYQEVSKSCTVCYTIHKSVNPCPRCAAASRTSEAIDTRFRG